MVAVLFECHFYYEDISMKAPLFPSLLCMSLFPLFLSAGSLNGEEKIKPSEPTKPLVFEKGKVYEAVIYTNKGKITCELSYEKAPLSVSNFIQLSQMGFYNGLKFHRVVPKFVIQGGDPEGTGKGGPGYTIPSEISLPHQKGALAWARLPDQVNPQKRSSGSQFYIALEKLPYLDGEYSVFGQTTQGMDVVEKISQGDTIEKIEIHVK